MSNEALLDAMRTGHESEVFLALARLADDVWLANSADDTQTIGVARVGSMNVSIDPVAGLVFHGHPDPQSARACQEANREQAALAGWTMVEAPQQDIAEALTRVPDAMVVVGGRTAEAYFV